MRKELQDTLSLDYLVIGSWSLKASQEAANLLEPLRSNFVDVALDSRRRSSAGRFDNIPPEDTWNLTPPRTEGGKISAFVYYCDNKTVDGVESLRFPECLHERPENPSDEVPVIANISSNFLSKRVDMSKHAVIFVGSFHCRIFELH